MNDRIQMIGGGSGNATVLRPAFLIICIVSIPERIVRAHRKSLKPGSAFDRPMAARNTSKLASNDDGNVGGAFALNTATRRGRARPRA